MTLSEAIHQSNFYCDKSDVRHICILIVLDDKCRYHQRQNVRYIRSIHQALIGEHNQKPLLAVFTKEALIGTVFGNKPVIMQICKFV